MDAVKSAESYGEYLSYKEKGKKEIVKSSSKNVGLFCVLCVNGYFIFISKYFLKIILHIKNTYKTAKI